MFHEWSSKFSKCPQISSRSRILQSTTGQILDVPCAGDGATVGGSAEDRFPRTESSIELWSGSLIFQFRKLKGNWWKSPRFPLRTGINSVLQRRLSRPCHFLSLRKVVEVPVIQTRGKTQQDVNIHVQNVVDSRSGESHHSGKDQPDDQAH